MFCGSHDDDGDQVHGGLFGCIENEAVLYSFLHEIVLWDEEDVRHKP